MRYQPMNNFVLLFRWENLHSVCICIGRGWIDMNLTTDYFSNSLQIFYLEQKEIHRKRLCILSETFLLENRLYLLPLCCDVHRPSFVFTALTVLIICILSWSFQYATDFNWFNLAVNSWRNTKSTSGCLCPAAQVAPEMQYCSSHKYKHIAAWVLL